MEFKPGDILTTNALDKQKALILYVGTRGTRYDIVSGLLLNDLKTHHGDITLFGFPFSLDNISVTKEEAYVEAVRNSNLKKDTKLYGLISFVVGKAVKLSKKEYIKFNLVTNYE